MSTFGADKLTSGLLKLTSGPFKFRSAVLASTVGADRLRPAVGTFTVGVSKSAFIFPRLIPPVAPVPPISGRLKFGISKLGALNPVFSSPSVALGEASSAEGALTELPRPDPFRLSPGSPVSAILKVPLSSAEGSFRLRLGSSPLMSPFRPMAEFNLVFRPVRLRAGASPWASRDGIFFCL